jgi:hypothetical protein
MPPHRIAVNCRVVAPQHDLQDRRYLIRRNAIEPLSALERRKSYWGALHSDVTFDWKSRLSGLVRTPGDRI